MKEFEKHSIIVFTLTMIGHVVNYLFQIVMSRMLDIASFGVLNTVSSFYAIISIPAAIILMFVSKYVSEYKVVNMSTNVLIKKTVIFVLLFSVVFLIVGISISGFIKTFLNIYNICLIYIIIPAAGFGYILYIALGGLQGEKKFIAFCIVGLIIPLTKLFGSIIFILLGLGLNGVIFSFLIGNIIAIFIGFTILKIDFKVPIGNFSLNGKFKTIQFAWAALLINIGTNVLTNIDIIMVKRYFSEEITGLYSVASILGKIIIFASSTIIFVLFPYAVEANIKNENRNKILFKSLLYGGGFSIVCAIGLNILSKYIIILLFGNKYLDSMGYIMPISIWVVLLSYIIIIANYLLAIDRAKIISYTMIIGCIVSFCLLFIFNSNIKEMIYILAAVSFGILLINIIKITFNDNILVITK